MATSERSISPEQVGELTKKFVVSLSGRSFTEGCALLESSFDWHIKEFLNEQGNFACDKEESTLGYPQSYTGLRPIREQLNLVTNEFGLDPEPALKLLERNLPSVPKWAEGWAAFPIEEDCKGTWADNVQKALIWHSGICGNKPGYYCGHGGNEGLVLHKHVQPYYQGGGLEKWGCSRMQFVRDWKRLVGGSVMIVPVQMGELRKGQSDRMVKAECSKRGMSEFPLGIFEVACLLAMHPSRLGGDGALGVNAPGDEYSSEGFIKTANCRWKQMGHMIRFSDKRLPSFGFGSGNLRDVSNGPFTASSWDIEGFLKDAKG